MATSITSLRNPIDDLTSKLNEPPTKPVGSIEQQLTSQRERGARAEELRPQVMKESLGSVETAMQDLQAKREAGAQDYGKMLEKQAKDTAALEEKYTAMRPEPIEFAPSQQTPEQLQTIAISMMLVGALAGGGAKRSGIAGLKAMTGMLDGYKQGRKDVFDREKIIFEKALETQRQKIEEVKSLYDSALRAQTAGQTAEANKFKALLEAEIQGGSMYVDIAKGRYDASNKMFDAVTKASDKATESIIAINKANEDRKLRIEMARERMQLQRELQNQSNQLRRDLAEMKQQQGSLKPGADVTKKFVSDNVLVADINDLIKDLQNPALKQKIQSTRPLEWAAEQSQILNQAVQTERDPDVRQFMTKIIRMRNKYYLDQSGKAVTGAEALRNYGAVPQPGDTPEVIDEKMKIMSKGVQDTINVYRQMFTGLPAIQVQPGMNTGVAAGEKVNPYATATPTIVQQPAQAAPSTGWTDEKERRLQELRAKQQGAQSGTQ